MRAPALALMILCCSCGPMGNTLGLQGTYTGDTTVSGSGKFTTYPPIVAAIVHDVEISNREAATLTVEAATHSMPCSPAPPAACARGRRRDAGAGETTRATSTARR